MIDISDFAKQLSSLTRGHINVEVFKLEIQALFDVHARQWELEDRCRLPEVGHMERGKVKQQIDRSNAARVKRIGTVDRLLSDWLHGSGGEELIWPMTVGQTLDTILISQLKSRKLGPSRPEAIESCTDMERAWACMINLLISRELAMPSISVVKSYGRNDLDSSMEVNYSEDAK
jgi:hypothetical protein